MKNIIITNKAATIVLDGRPFTVERDNELFDELLLIYQTGTESKLRRFIDRMFSLNSWIDEEEVKDVKVVDGKVFYKDKELDNVITQRILDWSQLSLDPKPMMRFLEKIMENTSYQAREELLLFLENSKLPIQQDGRFLAYKVVTSDFKDKHSRTFDNSIGKVVEMDRGQVDDNRQNTCSAGLHFCSKDYISSFKRGEDRLVLVAIDPADVVSIPYDYNNAKGRCCRYEVIAEVDEDANFKRPLYG